MQVPFQEPPSRQRRKKGFTLAMAGSTLVIGLAACGSSNNSTSGNSSSSTASAASCDSPGITANSITIGVLMPLSGAGVTQRAGWNDGVNAYFDQLNAAGGINHRTVNVVVDDDKSTASGSLDSGKDLVENKSAFSVIEAPLEDGALDYFQAQGVPDVGWSTADVGAKHSNFFSITGASLPGTGNSAQAQFMKDQGAANAQAMLSAHVDAASLSITNNVAIALYKAAKQAGVDFKAYVFPTFYDPAAEAQVANDVAGTFTALNAAPFELKQSESVKFQNAIQKYVPSGKANLIAFDGWLSADFTAEILQSLGGCPTRSAFIDAMQKKSYDGHGALGYSVQYHQPVLCSWFAKLTTSGYQPVGSKPVCGQKVTASS